MTMFRTDKKIPDFSGSLVAGGEVTFDLPIGPTYAALRIDTNILKAHLTFELELNGEVIYKLTGAELDDLDTYFGVSKVSELFNFPIALDQLHDASNSALSGLVTQAGDNLYLRVKIGATVVASPAMKIYAETNPSQARREFIPRFKPVQIPITSTGENEYQWQRQGAGVGRLQLTQIHFKGAVVKVEIEQDDLTQYDLPIKIAHAAVSQSKNDVRVPVAGYYHLDFVRHGYARDMFDTYSANKQLLFKITTSDSNDVVALTHSIERVFEVAAA